MQMPPYFKVRILWYYWYYAQTRFRYCSPDATWDLAFSSLRHDQKAGREASAPCFKSWRHVSWQSTASAESARMRSPQALPYSARWPAVARSRQHGSGDSNMFLGSLRYLHPHAHRMFLMCKCLCTRTRTYIYVYIYIYVYVYMIMYVCLSV